MRLDSLKINEKFTTASGTEFVKISHAKTIKVRRKNVKIHAECARTDTGEVYFLPDLTVFKIEL